MGTGTEGLLQMREEIYAENEVIGMPSHVRWLANPCTIWEGLQNADIATPLAACVVKGSNVALGIVKKGRQAAGVWY